MKRKLRELQVFNTLCDMHDGTRYLEFDVPHEVEHHQRISLPNSREVVELILHKLHGVQWPFYTNKELVVVEIDGDLVKAVYSYDNRCFGMVTIRVKPPKDYWDVPQQ